MEQLKEIVDMRETEKIDHEHRLQQAKADKFEAQDRHREVEKVKTQKNDELRRLHEEFNRATNRLN